MVDTFRCRCRANARYLRADCPDHTSHREWGDYPRYVDSLTLAVEEYHEQVLAGHYPRHEVAPPTVWGTRADPMPPVRQWPEKRETWVETPHPEPVQRAVRLLLADAPTIPKNAWKLAQAADDRSLPYRISHAIGYAFDAKTGGLKMKNVMELTGEFTEKGAARKKKVGEAPSDPVDSIRVVVRLPTLLLAGHWIDGGWDFGLILSGRTLVENANWSRLWEVFDAESSTNVRSEGGGDGWVADQLPLDGDT